MKPIGLAGCGRTGAPMLARLRDLGFEARGYDISRSALQAEVAASITCDPAAFSRGLSLLVITTPDIAACEALLFDDQAFVRKASDLRTIVLCSTLSPRYVRALRARVPSSIGLVDAPVSGSRHAARTGELRILAGGSEDDLDAARPVLSALGHVERMGPYGNGMAAKALHDVLSTTAMAAARGAREWGGVAGIDPARLLQIFTLAAHRGLVDPVSDDAPSGEEGAAQNDLMGALTRTLSQAFSGAHLAHPVAPPPRTTARGPGRPQGQTVH